MSRIKSKISRIERVLVEKFRAIYWHFEVEKLALEYFCDLKIMPAEVRLKANLYALIAATVHFFVEDEALLLERPETGQKRLE